MGTYNIVSSYPNRDPIPWPHRFQTLFLPCPHTPGFFRFRRLLTANASKVSLASLPKAEGHFLTPPLNDPSRLAGVPLLLPSQILQGTPPRGKDVCGAIHYLPSCFIVFTLLRRSRVRPTSPGKGLKWSTCDSAGHVGSFKTTPLGHRNAEAATDNKQGPVAVFW